MAANKKSLLSLSVLLLLMAAVFYFVFRNQDIAGVFAVIKQVDPIYLITGLAVMFLFLAGESTNIYLGLSSLGNRVSFRQCLAYGFVGFYFSAITPSASGGQPAQIYYMKKDGVPISHSTLSLLLNLMVFQFTMVVFAGALFLLSAKTVSQGLLHIKWLFLIGIAVNVLLIGFLCLVLFSGRLATKLVSGVIVLLTKCRLVKRPEETMSKCEAQLHAYAQGAVYIRENPRLLVKIALVSLVQIVAQASIPYFVYRSLGFSQFSFLQIITLQTILNLSVSYLPLPGSMGAAEGGFLSLFQLLFPRGALLGAMLLFRFISFYFYLVLSGLIALGKSVKINQSKKTITGGS